MPEDETVETEEVSEQEQKELFEAEEAEAFGLKPSEKKEEPEEKVDEEVEDKTETDEEEPEEPEETEEETEAETEEEEEEEIDEDVARGKEVLEAEAEAEKAEAERKEEEEKKAAEEEAKRQAELPPPVLDNTLAVQLNELVRLEELPDTIKIGDTELKLKTYLEDYPESKIIAGMTTRNAISALIDNGTLLPTEQVQERVDNAVANLRNDLFIESVEDKISKAVEISNSDAFKKWHGEKATDEEKALFRSGKSKDYIRGLRRYMNQAGLAKAKVKKDEADEVALKKKKEKDDLHSHSLDSSKPEKTKLSGIDEEKEAFMSKDPEDE
jgi:hypothetical protein